MPEYSHYGILCGESEGWRFCQFSTVRKVLNAELEFNKRDKLLYLVAKYDLGYDVEIFCYNSSLKFGP